MGDDEKMLKYLKHKYGDKRMKSHPDKLCWEFMYENIDEIPLIKKKLEKEMKKYYAPKKTSYLWLTLSPDKLLRNMDVTPEMVNKLHTWCENWFSTGRWYGDYIYVLECGSQGDHLHVHALLEMKSSHKHAELLKKSWAKHFPAHQLLTSVDATTKAYHNRKNIPTSQWIAGKHKGEYCYANFKEDSVDQEERLILNDKRDYMVNDLKSSHENLFDLGVRGSRGVLSDKS